MFSKILIANRGEIACRVMRSAARLGVRTVAVYSEADAAARHVALADEAVAVGPAPAAQSYLNVDRILAAARQTGAGAVHPGYGFLSENAGFAAACAKAGIVFIGPPPDAIHAMGSKSAAKAIMEKAGVPVVPGYHGEQQDPVHLAGEAERIGWPVLIKASAGGGGKGMRVVENAGDFESALASARREAKAAFDDDRVLLEKYLSTPRHVEIQVFRDAHGNCVHLFERDCSVQRRHQKVIEEAPAPGLDAARRRDMGAAAVAAAEAIGYTNAGTVEFILDANGEFFFMEMNTRLQVEHPVTELVTGQDLVEWQLRVASGEPLPLKQDQLSINGHAMEARVYAEDPERDYLPATGHLVHLRFPVDDRHVRVDSGVREGDTISIHYDPMIAKLIVWDRDRDNCARRLRAALAATEVVGVTTNLDLLSSISEHPEFLAGPVDTGFLGRHGAELLGDDAGIDATVIALGALYAILRRDADARVRAARLRDPGSPWHATDAWRLNAPAQERLRLRSAGTEYTVDILHGKQSWQITVGDRTHSMGGVLHDDHSLAAHIDGAHLRVTVVEHEDTFTVFRKGRAFELQAVQEERGAPDAVLPPGGLTAPMPGKVVDVLVREGDAVAAGAPLIVLEAMKMEHTIKAPVAGTVRAIHYNAGDLIDEGAQLIRVEP